MQFLFLSSSEQFMFPTTNAPFPAFGFAIYSKTNYNVSQLLKLPQMNEAFANPVGKYQKRRVILN